MAYDVKLADRMRKVLTPYKKDVIEKKMMGGLAFMLHGKMCCGIIKESLMVRVLENKYAGSLKKPFCREMDFTGRVLKGFLLIDKEGIVSGEELKGWMDLGIEFVNLHLNKK